MIDLDDALAQTKMTLRAEAARVADTEAALASISDGGVPELRRPSNRGRFLALAAASVMVIAGLVAVAWVKSDDNEPAGPDPSVVTVPPTLTVPQTAAPTIPSTAAPTTTTNPPVPVEVGSIADVFFADADRGWLTQSSSDGQFQTLQTVDGGANWVPVPSMPAGVSSVRFAPDATNGWAFDATSLWSTHDGGTTWTAISDLGGDLPPTPVVAIGTDTVSVPVARDGGVGLDAIGIATDAVEQLDVLLPYGAGPVMELTIVSQPDGRWMVYNDRTVQAGVRIVDGVVDTTWLPPDADQGGPVSVYGSSAGGPILAVAHTDIWAGDLANPRTILYVSDDGGATFRDVTPAGLDTVPFDVSAAGPSDIVVSTPWGDAGTTLLHSGDQGATWTQIANVPGVGLLPQYVSPTVAIATVNAISDGHQELWRSDDGGATWRPLAIGSAP